MGIYATVADVRARPDVADDRDEAEVELAIGHAEDLVDRLVGPRTASATTGRKWNVAAGTGLSVAAVDALRDVTAELAALELNDAGAFTPPAGESVSGPDFSISAPSSRSPAASAAIDRAAAKLDALNLRVRGARATLR